MYSRVTTLPTAGSGPLMMAGGGGIAAMNGWLWLAVLSAIACCAFALWNRSGRAVAIGVSAFATSLVLILASGQISLLLLALAAFTLVGAAFALERSLPAPLLGIFRRTPTLLAPEGRPQAPRHPSYGHQ